jgi:Flp pilus assembly protein TadG
MNKNNKSFVGRALTDESGQALIMLALSMALLMGFVALATDVGLLFRAKRNLQIAADAAATAGALEVSYGNSASTAAQAAATQNGVTNGSGGVVVTVNNGPLSGPWTGNTSYVEVIITQPNPTYFMKVSGISSVTVAARAVAGIPTAAQGCGWVDNKTASKALWLQGNYTLSAPHCGINVNSNASDAVKVTGNAGSVNATFLDVVGGISGSTSPTPTTTGAAYVSDPFGNLTGPTPTNGECTTTDSTTTTLSVAPTAPGLNNSICYTKAVTLSGVTLGAGTYVFESGVTISGTVTVTSGTIDIENGTFNQPSNTIVNITAPTSGTYNGIAIMQPATNTNLLQVQFGSNNQTLDGYIYAPGAEVDLQDNGGGVTATGFVADTVKIKASSITIPSYNAAHPTTTPLRAISLVE